MRAFTVLRTTIRDHAASSRIQTLISRSTFQAVSRASLSGAVSFSAARPACLSKSSASAQFFSSSWRYFSTTVTDTKYDVEFQRSISDPADFWAEKAQNIKWFSPPPRDSILTRDGNNVHRWFKGGKLNMSYLTLDVPIAEGRGDQLALKYDTPVTKQSQARNFTFNELKEEVVKTAGLLRKLGVKKGDRVVIYMPMIPQAVIAMLACARVGAIHSVVFGGFAPPELKSRIDDCKPSLLITANYGIEVERIVHYKPYVDDALKLCEHQPKKVLIFQRPDIEQATIIPGRDLDWAQEMARQGEEELKKLGEKCEVMDATDPFYVLYTSGTTGKPKGVVRDHSAPVAIKYSMDAVMNARPGTVYWAASDVGWVVGHTFIVYGPLMQGCTTILYEGKPVRTPDAGATWRMIQDHKVETLFCAPTSFRAIRKEDPEANLLKKYDISSLKSVFLAGERLDPPTFDWLHKILPGVNLIDNWWQTETGTPIAANCLGLHKYPVKRGSATKPVPGYDIQILDEAGQRITTPNTSGSITVKLPLPPGCFYTLWQNHERFQSSYMATFPGHYLCGDGGYFDKDGYLFVMGRTDDVINVAGHRLSTGEMEQQVGSHPAVAECCVIAVDDALKGEIPIALVVLRNDVQIPKEQVEKEIVHLIRRKIGPVASLHTVMIMPRLPKTRSGKIMRSTIKKLTTVPLAKGTDSPGQETVPIPAVIDDPATLTEVEQALETYGVGRFAKNGHSK